jgi:glycosyltransferase involved in cell wall biosynthesis
MKISLCMPVFGAACAKVFCDYVYSVLLQGYDDFELVVQDGDVEKPLAEVSHVKRVLDLLEDRFCYSCGRDRGIFHAANLALARATGDILTFQCSDDLLCPGALIAVNEAFESERFGGPYWLYGQTVSADVTGKTLGIDGELITYQKLLGHNQIGQPSAFWNRQMQELAGKFDPRYRHSADYDLWLRFWERREPLFLNQTLGIFRHHAEQASNVNAVELEKEAKRISMRHQSFSGLITSARNVQVARRAYPDGVPGSEN